MEVKTRSQVKETKVLETKTDEDKPCTKMPPAKKEAQKIMRMTTCFIRNEKLDFLLQTT